MQLDRAPASAQRRGQLTLAIVALLGAEAAHGQTSPADARLKQAAVVDSGLLWYQEDNHRIKDVEAIVNVRQPLAEERALNLRLTLDAVCGGSPIGALPSKSPQSFVTPTATTLNPAPAVQTTTSSSGGGGLSSFSLCSNPVQNQHYTVAPGQLPIDQSFHDERITLSGGFETPIDALTRLSLSGAFSHELDFVSGSVNGSLARDFNNRNTTFSGGLNLETDSISPIGGTPVAGSAYGLFDKGAKRSKTVETGVLGATQVITRRWLTQGTLTAEHSAGYETDPYKIVSILNAQGLASASPTADYVYENRPASRNRWGLFWDNRYDFDHDVLQASYRHTQDSWGVRSDTFEMHYRLALGAHGYLEPHLREYRQSAANFFDFYLDQGAPQPSYFSADPRLAAFSGQTLGLKYGISMDSTGGEFSVRVERYTQRGSGPSNVPVGLQGLDLYPGMSAWILQLGARFSF